LEFRRVLFRSTSVAREYTYYRRLSIAQTSPLNYDYGLYSIGGYGMAHLHADNEELLKRVRRIAGQVQAIERALQAKADCGKTLHLVAATRGALNGLLEQIIEAHAQFHVADPGLSDAQRQAGVTEVSNATGQYEEPHE